MIAFARNLRLIPIVLIAVASLFTLKILGLVLEGGYTLAGWQLTKDDPVVTTGSIPTVPPPPAALDQPGPKIVTSSRPQSWARRVFNFPDVTGSVNADKPNKESPPATAKKDNAKTNGPANPNAPPPKPNGNVLPAGGIVIPLDTERLASSAERALLERLHERREKLDTRARELEIRENLLKVAEKRLETRVAELKKSEAGPGGPAARKKNEAQRFKNLITIYENMKAKDAAKIFDRLDINILVEVATQINPRRMSDILAQMTPAAAERLTVELALRANATAKAPAKDLPKIGAPPKGQ
jgi:flagellar motility protein MotE (MotC chaperone)